MRILIVEDSEQLAGALQGHLRRQGHSCDHAADGAAALDFAERYPYDLVVLDLMLPRLPGLEVLRQLRARGQSMAVVVVSARDQIVDRVAALDAGADDYLVKPFALEELLARLRALARRPVDASPDLVALGELSVDRHTRRGRWQGRDLQLTPKEFALLDLLLRSRGRVLSRVHLFERLYDSTSPASDKAIEVIVSTLRTKLARAGAGEPIQTRRGFGYVVD
ncbi:response regulator transcription factor [Dokdonella sp. MW10]|uniref:response regulator transcription factor n=1 Tax=Dokdonella sp. MW10 TaxID=2992926 RepID=UPI003F8187E3